MNRRHVACALGLTVLGVSMLGTAYADTFRLDDSLSHTVPAQAQMQWLPATAGSGATWMEASIRVNILIDTRRWQDQVGRIYMVFPRDDSSSIEVAWTSSGPLQSGQMVSGERRLVYAGRIPGPQLRDQWQVSLRSAPDWPSNTRRLNFHFELDID